MNVLDRFVRRRLISGSSETASDAELLRRFLEERDETAFELLVHRHGVMVLGVSRRIMGDVHAAEDVFQATFLILARRSGAIQQRQSLGSWLYKVAYRLALRAKSRWKPQRMLEELAEHPQSQPMQHVSVESREEVGALVEEVSRLSERLRTVIILCCLQGKSTSEAAREIGCPVSTVSTRLYRAREQLRRNLSRRGIILSGSLALGLGCETAQAMTTAKAQALAAMAVRYLGGASLSSVAPQAVTSLMKGSVLAMWWKPSLVLIVLLGTLGLAAIPGWNAIAADEQNDQNNKSMVTHPQPKLFIPLLNQQQASTEGQATVINQFDLDGDGVADLIETSTPGHGVASTYFATYKLKAGTGYKILRWGQPLAESDTISTADVFNGVESVHLCTTSGSLMLPMKPSETRTGPWSEKKGVLALARLKDNVLSLGFISMTVTATGQMTIHESSFEPVQNDTVEITFKGQDDVADIKSKEITVGQDGNKKYMLIGPRGTAPEEGFGLVIVMPGGDGGIGFHPFVKRIYKNALPEGYLAVQPLPSKWAANQQITWPTEKNKVPGMKHTTEELINGVIDDVAARHKINPKKVFTLTWSSSGPAGYAASLSCPKVTGSFIAMSVFNPRFLPPLDKAKGQPYYLYHSPDDRTCPYRMAQQAVADLGKAGATVELKTYEGGHGWRGPLFQDISAGIQWLEKNSQEKK